MDTNADRIRSALNAFFESEFRLGRKSVRVVSGEIHKEIDFKRGSHPNQMPNVCRIMHECVGSRDSIANVTPSGHSSTLTIVYALPR